jgi:uncharacterized metal-binding protein YceD (DUF177 family)
MSTSKEYIIQFASLTIGEHRFELDINKRFFDNFDYSEIKEGDIRVNINLLKTSSMMVLDFEIGGTVKAICDRCASEFDLPITGHYKLTVKTGDADVDEQDDDIIAVSASESRLDLSKHLYEYITLALPIKREHETIADCDKEVLTKLNNFLVDDDSAKSADPRWNDLSKIKLN